MLECGAVRCGGVVQKQSRYLHQCDEEEEGVGRPPDLLVQESRQEREDPIFGRADGRRCTGGMGRARTKIKTNKQTRLNSDRSTHLVLKIHLIKTALN